MNAPKEVRLFVNKSDFAQAVYAEATARMRGRYPTCMDSVDQFFPDRYEDAVENAMIESAMCAGEVI